MDILDKYTSGPAAGFGRLAFVGGCDACLAAGRHLKTGLQANLEDVRKSMGNIMQGSRRREQEEGFQMSARLRSKPKKVFPRTAAFASLIPGDSAAELVLTSGISNFLNLYNTAIIGRIILTWFPNPPQVIAGPLMTICDPYLNLFRGIIPPLGGTLDLSPILAFIVLDLFSNTAAALPCEVGPDGKPLTGRKGHVAPSVARGWRRHLVNRRQARLGIESQVGSQA